MKINRKTLLPILLISLTLTSLELYNVFATPANINTTVEPGSMIQQCNYSNYTDGTQFFGRNGLTGLNDYNGADAGVIINTEITQLSKGGTICNGTGDFTGTDITIDRGITLTGAGWAYPGSNATTSSSTTLHMSITVDAGGFTIIQGGIIKDLAIILTPPNRAKIGITLGRVSGFKIENVRIYGFGEGIKIDGKNDAGHFNLIDRATILDNGGVDHMTYGVHITSSGGNLANFNWITHSRISAFTGIYNELGQDNKITFTDLSNNLNDSIRTCVAANCQGLTLENNYWELVPTVIDRDPVVGARAGLIMFLSNNRWASGITNKMGNIFPADGSVIDEPIGMECGSLPTPLTPGNTVDWCARMWVKIASGTVLGAGRNNYNFNTYLVLDGRAPCLVNPRTDGGLAISYQVFCFSTSNTNQLQVSILVTTGFTLTSDLVFYLILFPA